LPNVRAALVALSSDAALSERDLALLDELRRHTPKIVLLLTKADLLTEAQRAEVMAFVQGQVRRRLSCDLPVFFYSVLPSLVALKAELRDRLLNPLLSDRADANRQILRHKLVSLREQTLSYLRVGLAAATQAEAARQDLRERLDEERRQFGLLRQELRLLTGEWSAKALEQSLERLQPTERALQAKVTRELQTQFPQWRLRLPLLLRAWRDWLQSFLARELSEVSRLQQPVFCEPAQQAGAHLARTVRAFQDRLAEHVRAGLGVTLSPREFNPKVPEPSAPPVDVSYAFDAAFSTLGWAIPLTLFRRPIERVLLRKARYEVRKNLSRLAAGWQERVGTVIEELRRQAEKATLDELDALTRMMEQSTSSVPGLRQQIARLEMMPVA
jgi:hypothetical protein